MPAYEMRISDWSSDVCSSDLPTFLVSLSQIPVADHDVSSLEFLRCGTAPLSRQLARDFKELIGTDIIEGYGLTEATSISAMNPRFGEKRIRSEEHTSELQSLMCISYAVFCLKKKNKNIT